MKKLFTLTCLLLAGVASKAQTIPEAGLENWHTANSAGFIHLQVPNGGAWHTMDSLVINLIQTYVDTGTVPDINAATTLKYFQQVFPKNNAHTGVAAQLVTRFQDTTTRVPGCIANCDISINAIAVVGGTPPMDAVTFSGGTDISAAPHRPASVGAWIEYFPKGNDTAHMKINILNASNAVIGTVDTSIVGTVSTFTYVKPTISYTTTTGYKKLQVIFSSSKIASNAGQDSSILYVDDVDINIATGVEEPNANAVAVKFGPNPTTGVVYLHTNVAGNLSWQVYNTNGQVVVNKALEAHNREDLSYLPSGTYFYNVLNSKGEVIQKDKFTIAK